MDIQHLYRRFGISLKYGFKLNKPKMLSRLAANYLMLLCGKIPIRTIDFAPTFKCNMNCKHCFASLLDDPLREPLGKEDYVRIANESYNMGAVHIAFQGGEPLIYEDLMDIINLIKPERFIVSITTNGYLLNQKRIVEFKKAGVDMFTISIDSGIAAEHDKFRQMQGAYYKAIEAVDNALKYDMAVCINTMVTRSNIYSEGLKKIIAFCKQKRIKLTVVLPAMAGKWREAFDLMLDNDAYEYLQRLMKKYPFIRRDLDANYWHWGCGAVKEMIYVNAYGDVFPCAFIHCSLGNLKEESLSVIRERGLRIKEFSHYHHNCLAAEDISFIKQRLKVTVGKDKLPVSLKEMFPEYV